MLNENAQSVALVSHVQQFEVHRNQFFTNIYQFVVVTAQMDLKTSDLAIFVTTTTTTDDRHTNRLLYPLRMRMG